MQKYGITLLFSFIVTFMIMYFKYGSWTITRFVDSASLTSIILIIFGSILFVTGQGFFSGIYYSFRRFFKKTSDKWKDLDESDESEIITKHNFSFTTPSLVVGISCLFIISIISYVVY